MADRVLSVLLTANAASFRQTMLQASTDTARLGREVEDTGKRAGVSAAAFKTGFAAAGLAVAAGLGVAAKAALDFDKNMRNVTSLSQVVGADAAAVEAQFESLSGTLLELSTRLPQSAAQLSEGLYQVSSSGFAGAEGVQVLTAAGEAASAGLTNTSTAVEAIAGVLNAYGREAGDATAVSDTLFQTVNVGVLSFEDLAQNLGDVVGLAAAAGISIEDVGSAVATLTRSGIVPAQAFTSLRSLFTKIVRPTEELAFVIDKLGYESGIAAVKANGLNGFINELREETGGSADAMSNLFRDVEATTGALVLMGNEGKTYAETQRLIGDETQRTGQTQRTLQEQSKSVSFQLQVLRNQALKPLLDQMRQGAPALAGFIKGLGAGTTGAGAALGAAMTAAGPAIGQVLDLLGALGRLGINLASDLAPIAGALLAAVGLPILGGLGLLASGLEAIVGFLDANRTILEILIVAYGVRWVAALIAGSTHLGLFALAVQSNAVKLASMGVAAGAASAGTAALAATTTALATAMRALPLLAVVALVTDAIGAFSSARSESAAFSAELTKDLDLKTGAGVEEALARVRNSTREAEAELHRYNFTAKGTFDGIASFLPGVEDGYVKAGVSVEELTKEQLALNTQLNNFRGNAALIFQGLPEGIKLSEQEIGKFAQSIGVDLTQAYGASEEGRKRVTDGLVGLAERAGLSQKALSEFSRGSIQAQVELAESADAMAKRVGESFIKAGDIVGAFGGKASVTSGEVAAFYSTAIADSTAFLTQIGEATRRGLDPGFIARLLEAGPAQAAPVLKGILSDHSNGLIGIANQSEVKLREINDLAVRLARITNIAVNASSDDMAASAGIAMQIVTAKFETGGRASADAIANQLGIGVDKVLLVSEQYGLGIQASANQVQGAFGAAAIQIGNVPGKPGAVFSPRAVGRAEGGIDAPHSAEIAPGGAWRVWAEPETGGEAYIPLASSKRERSTDILRTVAHKFDLALVDPRLGGSVQSFAQGGLYGSFPPPRLNGALYPRATYTVMDYEWKLLQEADRLLKQRQAAAAAQAPEPGGGTFPSSGKWTSIVAALSSANVPFRITSTTGGKHAAGSYHYKGKAVDLVSGNMMSIFNTLAKLSGSLSELFHTPAGYSIKNSKRVPPIAAAGHYNHVHAATYDRGGSLMPGWTMAYNGTGKAETVVNQDSLAQALTGITQALERIPRGGNKVTINEAQNARQLVRAVSKALG